MIISPFPQAPDLELYRIHITSTTTVLSNDRMLKARIALPHVGSVGEGLLSHRCRREFDPPGFISQLCNIVE